MKKTITILILLLTVGFLSFSQDIKPISPLFKNLQSPSFSFMIGGNPWMFKGSSWGSNQWTELAGWTNVKDTLDSYWIKSIVQAKLDSLDNAKQDTITLTTIGTSGAATFIGSTLNIPQYSGGAEPGHDSLTIAPGSTGYFDVNYPQIFSGQKLIDTLGVMNTKITGKEPILTKGNLTAGSSKVTIGGTGTGALIGAGASIDINEANIVHQNISGSGTNTHAQIDTHITNDLDLDPNNENQDLSLSGNTLSLSGDASTVDLSGYAPASGSANYIWSQKDQSQSASGHISGSFVVGKSDSLVNQSAVFFGNSVTAMGRFSHPLCDFLGLTEVNLGIPSTTMHDFYTRYSEIPTYSNLYKYIFIDYGINDANNGYTVSDFYINLGLAIDQFILQGWPLSSIVIITPNWISGPAANLEDFALAAVSVAKNKGVQYTRTYWYMKDNGSASLLDDQVHPSVNGGLVMARSIYSSIDGGGEYAGAISIRKSLEINGKIRADRGVIANNVSIGGKTNVGSISESFIGDLNIIGTNPSWVIKTDNAQADKGMFFAQNTSGVYGFNRLADNLSTVTPVYRINLDNSVNFYNTVSVGGTNQYTNFHIQGGYTGNGLFIQNLSSMNNIGFVGGYSSYIGGGTSDNLIIASYLKDIVLAGNQAYPVTINSTGNINSFSYSKDGTELKLDAHKIGSLGQYGYLYAGTSTNTTPNWLTVNQAIGNDSLTSGYLPYWDGFKLVNSPFATNGTSVSNSSEFVGFFDIKNTIDTGVIPLISLRSDFTDVGKYGMIRFGDKSQTSGYQKGAIIYEGVSGAARGRFHIALNNDDTSASVTLSDKKFTIESDGRVTISYLSGTGTRLTASSGDGTLSSISNASGYLYNDGTNMSWIKTVPQSLSGTTPALDASNGVNANLSISGATTLTLSNLISGTSGNIYLTNNASVYRIKIAGYTLDPASNITYDSTGILLPASSVYTHTSIGWYYNGTTVQIHKADYNSITY